MKYALALLVATTSAVKLATQGDCDWECGKTGNPETPRNNGDPTDTHTEVPTSRSHLITNKDGILISQISHKSLHATALASFKRILSHTVKPITVLLEE